MDEVYLGLSAIFFAFTWSLLRNPILSRKECRTFERRLPMDVVYLGIAVGFFAITWGLIRLCQSLGENR
jgi:hypothetical protein